MAQNLIYFLANMQPFMTFGTSAVYVPEDANGNITDLVNTNGISVASYEYDPYGNVILSAGSQAQNNCFRFSTKYFDDETGLGNWTHRYYHPDEGRWLSRDPMDEMGGINLSGYCREDPINCYDPLGETFKTNWEFFWDWVLERGATNRFYGEGTVELQEIGSSPGATKIRDKYKKGKCKDLNNQSFGTLEAYFKTAFMPNSTAFQVGGFLYDAKNNHDGTVTYTVRNQASAYSLFLHIPTVPHKPRGGKLRIFGNIDQTFTWTEEDQCCKGIK
jgi:RHS repeat-associated protein